VSAKPIAQTYCATVANLLLDVGNNSSFGDGAQWQDVANGEGCVLASVDELSSVHALVGNEGFGAKLVSVWVAEGDFCERGATTWVVNYVFDYSSNISMSLSLSNPVSSRSRPPPELQTYKIERSEFRWGFVETVPD
jgi:hypothetical protein